MQSLYEWDMRPDDDPMQIAVRNMENFAEDVDRDFVVTNLKGAIENLSGVDELIAKAAPEWPLEQVSPIDKSILRLAIHEILHSPDVPPKVIINEAVELGKSYGGDNTGKFVNGVLGTVYRGSNRFKEESVQLKGEVKNGPKSRRTRKKNKDTI